MSLPTNPKAILQDVIRQGHAVIVSGTGVSIAASQFHPQASWTGLLDSGLSLLTKHGLITDDQAKAHRQLLSSSPATAQFIATAQAITSEMSPKMFRAWLKDTVGDLKAKDAQLLDVLEDMRQLKNLLATTNYDGLLLESRTGLAPVTWHDKAAFLSAYRNRDHDKVLFLHGYWDVPESVILDERSYQEIARDKDYREKLAAIWLTSTWIYVGCGESGLTDPDLGLLLDVYGQRARDDGHWDFLLALKKDVARLQDFFNRQGVNICVVGYGDKHTDLVPFLRSLLPPPASAPPVSAPASSTTTPTIHTSIPQPPAFYAEPDYIGSHQFVGRQAELDALSDWANRSDPTNLLLFEAIGGNGKSMLTWEWSTKHATKVRPDWSGRFWYSFYERGAIMQDFCQRALAYMTGRPLKEFEKRKTAELKDELIAQLHSRPWLLILDGLERVLVAYHRIDAAEVPDEEANAPTDKILNRNPCDAIRDEDNDLLRALAACAPSKILVSSRLTPRILLNPAGQPIPGAKRITLPGLRPPDAEALLRQCSITGDSAAIQDYLRQNCDNHPLVIGILAGLIANYLPDRGNFDTWRIDHSAGAALDLGKLDLIQRRNHILQAAIDAVPSASRQLLSSLSLLSESADYEMLKALNPHLPQEPEWAKKPRSPSQDPNWTELSKAKKRILRADYKAASLIWQDQKSSALVRFQSTNEYQIAPQLLAGTVHELEQRGLVQFDTVMKRYDIHPVVRSVALAGLSRVEQLQFGQRVVDHFSQRAGNPYVLARTRDDLSSGLHLVRALFKIGRVTEFIRELRSGLMNALIYIVEDYSEALALMRPLFEEGWGQRTRDPERAWLCQQSAVALKNSDDIHQSSIAYQASIRPSLEHARWSLVRAGVSGVAAACYHQNQLADSARCYCLSLDFAEALEATLGKSKDNLRLIISRNCWFRMLSTLGRFEEAEACLDLLTRMSPSFTNDSNRGYNCKMELDRAVFNFHRDLLSDTQLLETTQKALAGSSRVIVRDVHRLRGSWCLLRHDYPQAANSFQEAVRMAREVRLVDPGSETGLALAKHHLGQLTGDDARSEAERLTGLRQPAHRTLALLWLALGDHEHAKHHALAAYRWAWADGEPYVHRYELTKTTELLNTLGVPIPNLPPYDPAKDEPFPWEADVRAAIEKLKAEKQAKAKK